MQIYHSPWSHAITDDLVQESFLELLTVHANDLVAQQRYGLHHFNTAAFDPVMLDLYDQYRHQVMDLLPTLLDVFPQHRPFQSLDFVAHLAVQPAGYGFRPHCDHFDKIFSLVSYISPTQSQGTHLHFQPNDQPWTTVPWQPGRTMIFAGINDTTWHSYASGDQARTTLCAFFVKGGTDPTV